MAVMEVSPAPPTVSDAPPTVSDAPPTVSNLPDRRGRQPGARREHIPADVARAVRHRDGFRCTYVSPAGRRCNSTRRVEIHHRDPSARGGPPTVPNLTLLCRAHNHHAAERDFGPAFMAERRKRR